MVRGVLIVMGIVCMLLSVLVLTLFVSLNRGDRKFTRHYEEALAILDNSVEDALNEEAKADPEKVIYLRAACLTPQQIRELEADLLMDNAVWDAAIDFEAAARRKRTP